MDETVSLKEFFETQLKALREHVDEKFEAQREALNLADENLTKQLSEMSQKSYVLQDDFDTKNKEIAESIQKLREAQNKLLVWFSIAGFIGGVVGSALMRYFFK